MGGSFYGSPGIDIYTTDTYDPLSDFLSVENYVLKDFFHVKKKLIYFFTVKKSDRTKFHKKIKFVQHGTLSFLTKNVAFLKGKKVGQTKKTAS